MKIINNDKLTDISALEEDILTLLANNEKLYGLEFINAFNTVSQGRRPIGVGSLYPTLQRLQRKKLVNFAWGDEESGPRRKYYSITEYGRSSLQALQKFRTNLSQWKSKTELDIDIYEEKISKNIRI